MAESAKKKIALMSYAMDNRNAKGTALYTRKLIEHLLNDDQFEFTLVHYDATNDPLYKKAHEIIMPRIWKLPFGTRFIRQMLFFWKYRNNQFDIIHWFQPRVYPFFWFAPARKIMITAHAAGDITAPSFFSITKEMFNFVLKHFNKYVDMMVAVSEYAREEIIIHYKADPQRVIVTYNGGGEVYKPLSKVESQTIAQEKYNISVPYILDISRLQPHKNIDTLIKAYIIFRTQNQSQKQSLVIVGSPVYGHEQTYELAKNSEFSNDIHFISYVEQEDLNALYSGARLFVFPSVNEGFGLPVLESFASGTPVITSNVTSLPEIAGDAAITVDPYNTNELADKMYEVLSNEQLQQDLISRGLERSRKFTWEATAEHTKNIYLNL